MPTDCQKCVAKDGCSLSRSSWFQSIKALRIYGRHVTIARQGRVCKHIYILKRGWMQIMHVMPNGKSIVDLCGPGWIIGITSAMTGDPYVYSSMTLEDCEIEEVETDKFLEYMKKDVFVAFDILRYVSRQRIRLLHRFYEAASKVPSEERLRRVLVEISQTCGVRVEEGVRINLPLPIQVLADWIGCSRQWASRLLNDLEACGALRRRNGWITLPNAEPDPKLCRRFPSNPRCQLVDITP